MAKIKQGNGDIPLKITRIVSGAGTDPDPLNLSGVVDPRREFMITDTSADMDRTTIYTSLSNAADPDSGIPALEESYPLSQIGFYAIDPDVGEILYRISQFGEPITVPAFPDRVGWIYRPSFNIVTGNATTVIVEIDPSLNTYVITVNGE
jgi:hypothetical protein